jgi:hypothetical protein
MTFIRPSASIVPNAEAGICDQAVDLTPHTAMRAENLSEGVRGGTTKFVFARIAE